MPDRTVASLCVIVELQSVRGNARNYSATEYIILTDGDYVLIRDRLGWTSSSFGPSPPQEHGILKSLLSDVRGVASPTDRQHLEELALAARERGFELSAEDLGNLPFKWAIGLDALDAIVGSPDVDVGG